MVDELIRGVVVDPNRCRPAECGRACMKHCPINFAGKLCIYIPADQKIVSINERMCIACGQCREYCPYEAISICNFPASLEKDTTHRYGQNAFRMCRLPIPRTGEVLGLFGKNGVGKSTVLKILAGKLKPNLGKFREDVDWAEILTHFRGSELHRYFTNMINGSLKATIKPQYIDYIPKAIKGTIGTILQSKDQRGMLTTLIAELDMTPLLERNIEGMSGGELQRFAICVVALQRSDIYMFDEPSSYLDVKQRLKAAAVIRSLLTSETYVMCVEHDLALLDYLSDSVCCFYGEASVYGVVTIPFGVREGINVFLAGYIPRENVRFRDTALTFQGLNTSRDILDSSQLLHYEYPAMTQTFERFHLTVESGQYNNSEIIVLLGENGSGKTTLIKMLAGILKPDEGIKVPELRVSYKPQVINPKFQGTVRALLQQRLREVYDNPQFNSDVLRPLQISSLLQQEVQRLSGGELQRVALVLALGKPADIYFLDEPSAFLDSELRVIVSKVIKRYIATSQKTAFVVEHDMIMATYLADKIIVFEGEASRDCVARAPESLVSGMNRFLATLGITFRRDPTNFRPRINKIGSVKDREQKRTGDYFSLEECVIG